jgi:hypothetical protein
VRVFKQFSWLEARSAKVAFSRPAHQRVTQTVGRVALELIYFHMRLMYDDFVPLITNRLII